MSEPTPHGPPPDPIAEGARARALGRRMDSCPYPLESDAREAWLEGYHGAPSDRAPDLPMDSG